MITNKRKLIDALNILIKEIKESETVVEFTVSTTNISRHTLIDTGERTINIDISLQK